MTFRVEWSKAAAKQLVKIPKKERLIIMAWVQAKTPVALQMESNFRAPIPDGVGGSAYIAYSEKSRTKERSSRS